MLDEIGVGRIRTFPFLPILFTTLSLIDPVKLGQLSDPMKVGCRSRKQKQKNQPIAWPVVEYCDWFIRFCLRLRQCSFYLIVQRRSHKQNQCSASDSVAFIFTRSYRSKLLITTPTASPSLVKTSLQRLDTICPHHRLEPEQLFQVRGVTPTVTPRNRPCRPQTMDTEYFFFILVFARTFDSQIFLVLITNYFVFRLPHLLCD